MRNSPTVSVTTTGLVVVCLLMAGLRPAVARTSVHGGKSEDHGFTLGLSYFTSLIGTEDPAPSGGEGQLYVDERGHGLALLTGYRFTPHFCLRLVLGAAGHETTHPGIEVLRSEVTLEALYRFASGHPLRPYVCAGLGGAGIDLNTGGYKIEANGGSAVVGLGVTVHLINRFQLDGVVRLDLINWDRVRLTRQVPGGVTVELEAPVEDGASAGKIQLGLTWLP